MEKINITKPIKREVANKIKRDIKIALDKGEDMEQAVMYSIRNGFYLIDTKYVNSYGYRCDLLYKIYKHNKNDKMPTLKQIEEIIFS